ncbi:MAG: sugar kinase [Ruminococcus sp.]|nr:sugar kinase [Ruminococcus sp.]
MKRLTDIKIVLITQKTRLENLVARYNTVGQAQFYIEHHGGDFEDYLIEDRVYHHAIQSAVSYLESYGRLQVLDREFVPGFLFGEKDMVVVIGRDGLVANSLKYLSTQKLIGVNPDPSRWDGVLLPFTVADLEKIVPETDSGIRRSRSITMAQATLNDGQTLIGVNDIFIGQRTHASARYTLTAGAYSEQQSSSGIIVSTGLGATGWLKSVLAGASGIDRYCGVKGQPHIDSGFTWESEYLYYTVREPYPSKTTGVSLVFGKVSRNTPLKIASQMAYNGVIFSDGMEQDCIEFNSGAAVEIGVCHHTGNLVI